mmetsp:Transcript_39450/g.88293  ORF Transcript_39450/g.88293 Transcript_39450/m.88293 type:complete len:369 (+) Transcript_39450:104-1210(+)
MLSPSPHVMVSVCRGQILQLSKFHRSHAHTQHQSSREGHVIGTSRVVRVNQIFVGWVRIEALLQKSLCLIHKCPQLAHLWLDDVTQEFGLLLQLMGLLGKHGLKGIHLSLDAGVKLLTVSAQSWHLDILREVNCTSWQEASLHHLNHRLHFNANGCDIALVHHLRPCLALIRAENLEVVKDLLVLLCCKLCNGQRSVVQVWQSPLLGLLRPLCTVTVACEDHLTVLLVDLGNSITVGHTTLDQPSQVSHARCHDGVADGNREGAVLRGAHSTELKAVSAEWERCGAVTILDAARRTHSSCCFGICELLLGLVSEEGCTSNDGVHMLLEAGAWVQRDDRRWRLLSTESVIIARMRHSTADKGVVLHQAV